MAEFSIAGGFDTRCRSRPMRCALQDSQGPRGPTGAESISIACQGQSRSNKRMRVNNIMIMAERIPSAFESRGDRDQSFTFLSLIDRERLALYSLIAAMHNQPTGQPLIPYMFRTFICVTIRFPSIATIIINSPLTALLSCSAIRVILTLRKAINAHLDTLPSLCL